MTRLSPFQLGLQHRQFLTSTDKRRFGQRASSIVQPDNKSWLQLTSFQRLRDDRQIGDHGLRGLVPIARILSQQSLDHFVQHTRYRQPQTSQFWRLHRHVLSQDFTDALSLKRRPASEALKEHDPYGVQVGARADFLVEESRSLRRHVLRGPDPLISNTRI